MNLNIEQLQKDKKADSEDRARGSKGNINSIWEQNIQFKDVDLSAFNTSNLFEQRQQEEKTPDNDPTKLKELSLTPEQQALKDKISRKKAQEFENEYDVEEDENINYNLYDETEAIPPEEIAQRNIVAQSLLIEGLDSI